MSISFVVKHHSWLKTLHVQSFRDKANGLAIEFEKEREDITERHFKTIEDLENFNEIRRSTSESDETQCIQDHEQRREVMKNQHTEHVDSLRKFTPVCKQRTTAVFYLARPYHLVTGLLLDTRVEDVEERFEAAHLSYLAEAQDKIKRTKDLAKRDQEHLRLINIKARCIDRLVASIKHMEVKVKSKTAEGASHTEKLDDEKDNIGTAFRRLKVYNNSSMKHKCLFLQSRFSRCHQSRLFKQRKFEAQRLTDLAINSARAQTHLETALALSQRIQNLAKLAKKFESNDGRVLPFRGTLEWVSSLSQSPSKTESPVTIEEVRPAAEPHELDLVWKKHNKVVSICFGAPTRAFLKDSSNAKHCASLMHIGHA